MRSPASNLTNAELPHSRRIPRLRPSLNGNSSSSALTDVSWSTDIAQRLGTGRARRPGDRRGDRDGVIRPSLAPLYIRVVFTCCGVARRHPRLVSGPPITRPVSRFAPHPDQQRPALVVHGFRQPARAIGRERQAHVRHQSARPETHARLCNHEHLATPSI